MPYSNKQMLRDANGDLIPQYWDVAEQEFKPLTGRDGANDVRLTGSMVAYLDITNEVGLVSAGTSFRYTIPWEYEGNYKFVSIWFRREAGTLEEIYLQHWAEITDRLPEGTREKMEYLSAHTTINVTKKMEVLSKSASILLHAGEETDFVPRLITVTLWN